MRHSIVCLLMLCSGSIFSSSIVIVPGLSAPDFIAIGLDQCVLTPRSYVIAPEGQALVIYGDYRQACIIPDANEAVVLDTKLDCLAGATCSQSYNRLDLRLSIDPTCVRPNAGQMTEVPACMLQAPRVNYQRLPVRVVERPLVHGVYHGRMNAINGSFRFEEALTASITRAGGEARLLLQAVGPALQNGTHASFRQFDWTAREQPIATTIFSGENNRYFIQQAISSIKLTESNGASVILVQKDGRGRDLVNIMIDEHDAVDPRRIPGRFRMYGPDPFEIGGFELKACIVQRSADGFRVASIDCPIYRDGSSAGTLYCTAIVGSASGGSSGGNACTLVIHGLAGSLVKQLREGAFAIDAWYNEAVPDPRREYVLLSVPFALRIE